jgi:dihydroflavonol-4-reductase
MITVTGGTGHIGNVVVRELVGRGETVRLLVRSGGNLESVAGLGVEIVEGDVRDLSAVRTAVSGADVVYHVAGLIRISPGRGSLLHDVNVGGIQNVIEACAEEKVRRLVYTSSVHAFVELPEGTCLDESSPLDPDRVLGHYARSKAEATLALRKAVAQGLDAVVVFPSGVIGPYDYRPSDMGQLTLDVARGRLPFYVDGAYDFVDVRDVAAGVLAAADRGRSGEGYLLCGNRVRVKDFIDAVCGLTGARPPRMRAPRRVARAAGHLTPAYYRLTGKQARFTTYAIDVLYSNCEMTCAKARRELGFEPRPPMETIADTVRWFHAAGRL